MGKPNFDDIRPYSDSEVNEKINELLQDPNFRWILMFLFKDEQKIAGITQMLSQLQSIEMLQKNFMYQLVQNMILPTTEGVTCSGLENFDTSDSYLFISNHRDIILDSALLNYMIFQYGMNTTEIAIGDNLLIEEWIVNAVKLNRAFVVKRNLPVRELLMASKKLSEYIREDIVEKNTSVWIAQREGRTKDGFDKTQPALLKMFNLSNKKDFAEGFKELKIVPLSISYEIEPCGNSKVEELYKRETEGYEKTQADDMKSMGYGLTRPKGRVHFAFGKPVTTALDDINQLEQPGEKIEALAAHIDKRIYKNYKLWPSNYIAADLLAGTDTYKEHYSEAEYEKFTKLRDEVVGSIDGDKKRITEMFLSMYATPVKNQEKVID